MRNIFSFEFDRLITLLNHHDLGMLASLAFVPQRIAPEAPLGNREDCLRHGFESLIDSTVRLSCELCAGIQE